MSGTPLANLRRVAARRRAQTRAYFAWLLRWALDNDWVSGEHGFDPAAVSANVAIYLDMLDEALNGLATGATYEITLSSLATADSFYDAEVRTVLGKATAHTRYRYWIFPYLKDTGGLIGYWDRRTAFSLEEAEAALCHVFKRCQWEPALLNLASAFLLLKSGKNESDARIAFNSFLCHPSAFQEWAMQLADINPTENRFCEPLFEFH